MTETKTSISLIENVGRISGTFKEILKSINSYLLRNKGVVSDFNLIKDIVDRNIDSEEDIISSNLPIPLYLGLIGTMMGIIIGLIAMPSLSDDGSKKASDTHQKTIETTEIGHSNRAIGNTAELNTSVTDSGQPVDNVGDNQSINTDNAMKGVDSLLAGVKIAMIASVVGLLFTTINSFMFYFVRQKTEREKNNFFTFIQTQLLPILSQNTASSLQTLQTNLLKFNESFSQNMAHFDGVIKEVRSSFQSQLEVVQELKRIDVSNMAKYNIKVMKQIESSFTKLNDLSEYLNNVNGLLVNTRELNLAVNSQLGLVGQISTVVDNFDANAKNVVEGSNYLQTHFANFDKREQAISNSVADFDSSMGDIMDSLKKSFEERLKKFNEKDVEINSGFEKLFENLREKTASVFDDESQNITAIKRDVVTLNNSVNQIRALPAEVSGLKSSVRDQDATLKTLLKEISEKPMQFKMPLFLIVSVIITLIGILATCGVYLYQLLT